MKKNNFISVYIILAYKPEFEVLEKNVEILGGEKFIIVDNSEDPKITEKLRILIGNRGELIVNNKNLGYTGGMNIGMKKALEMGATWCVLLNDDLILTKDSVKKVLEYCSDNGPSIAGPYPGYLDKKRWSTILPKYATKNQIPDYLSGSFLLIHEEIINKLQCFYPDFFMYYEDVDFCIQAKKAGYPLNIIDLAGIKHLESKSIEAGSPAHEYYLARNHLLFVERQAPLTIKLRELIRIPKTLYEHQIFFNKAAKKGVIDFMFLRYGKAPYKL